MKYLHRLYKISQTFFCKYICTIYEENKMPKKPANFGTWKCAHCNFIAKTRRELYRHKKEFHLEKTKRGGWNKGISYNDMLSSKRWSIDKVNSILEKIKNASHPGPLTKEAEISKREKLSQYAKTHNYGGYKRNSGIGKHGWYKGIWCDSSWELAFVIYSLDNGYTISRCKEKRTYVFENKIRTYIPDFVVNGKIIEIKGYSTPQWQAKINANKDIVVIGKAEIQPILNWVINKYGKDFIKLYETK